MGRLAVFDRLAQRPGWRVYAAAQIADIVNYPALAFADHQHFITPALVTLFKLYAQRNVACITIRNGRCAGDAGTVR